MQESGSQQTMQKQIVQMQVQPTAAAVTGGFARLSTMIVASCALSAIMAMPAESRMSTILITA